MAWAVSLYQPSILLIEKIRKKLKERVQFQNSVIDRMCDSLLSRSVRDFNDTRVLYAALLNGTSWCWKTTLAQEFASILNEELKKEVGKGLEIKFWKIDLWSWHCCEIPTLVGSFSAGWWSYNSGDSKTSKLEEIMEEAELADPLYCRGVILLDEIDKALKSDISNPSTAIDKLSELFESSSPLNKRKGAKRLRMGNFIIFLWANFFTNVRNSKQQKIGFTTDEKSGDEQDDPNEIEPIDKEEVKRKLGEYLTVSSINRFDDVHIFENAFPADVRRGIISKHFDSICEAVQIRFVAFDPRGQILPSSFEKPKVDDYLDEVFANADKEGWIRSLKRTLELRIKPKIMEFYLKQLSPENQYVFLQAQHEHWMEQERRRIKHARMERMLDDGEEAIWPSDSDSNI